MKTLSIFSYQVTEILLSQNEGKWKTHVTYFALDEQGNKIYPQRVELTLEPDQIKNIENIAGVIGNAVKLFEETPKDKKVA